ncbi:tail fiber protein [Sinomicrobium kalidii]|uniref:tail fiber protein n=1 Tax=Sinomicrobium kalidii TaxID=2900738 RepID=UPI001E3AF633|nr:tail fiber protein [Sinomicrobium kalidii]UGU18124.1 tail fiber protein [Sinomicrobium kalidii]
MKKHWITTSLFMIVIFTVGAQTVDAGYLNPMLGSPDLHKITRFGTSSGHYAGLMWNVNNANYGDGDDFSIFTYTNRDMTIRTGTGNFIVFPSSGGNMGIGTTKPTSKLHVKGDFYLLGNDSYENGWKKTHFYWSGHSLIMGSKEGVYSHNKIELKPGGASRGELYSSIELYQAITTGQHEKRISLSSHYSKPTYFNAGNVGIGTTSPDAKLTVKGKIHTQEVKVDLAGAVAPDYVFKEGYDLRSLEEVQAHIKEKGHLPNIPSAGEMEEEGINLKEMNLKLLEKVEELTLYTIQQEEKLQHKEEKINNLEGRVKTLEQLITNKKQ